jgi:hypothetical protein
MGCRPKAGDITEYWMTRQKKTVKPKAPTLRKAGATTKLAKLETMLRRPEGATTAQLMKALDWQAHSVRGAMSGTLKKKGLKVSAGKEEGQDRIYRIVE